MKTYVLAIVANLTPMVEKTSLNSICKIKNVTGYRSDHFFKRKQNG